VCRVNNSPPYLAPHQDCKSIHLNSPCVKACGLLRRHQSRFRLKQFAKPSELCETSELRSAPPDTIVLERTVKRWATWRLVTFWGFERGRTPDIQGDSLTGSVEGLHSGEGPPHDIRLSSHKYGFLYHTTRALVGHTSNMP